MVADTLGSQHDTAVQLFDVVFKILQPFFTEADRSGGRMTQFAAGDHFQHSVLQHLGIGRHVIERALVQSCQHGVGDVAHTRLQRQQVLGQTTQFHFMVVELQQMLRNPLRVSIRRRKFRIAVAGVGFNHGHDFFRIHPQIGHTDAIVAVRHGNRQAMGWKLLAVVHVVHAVEVDALAAVDFQNHLVGQFHPGLVVAN